MTKAMCHSPAIEAYISDGSTARRSLRLATFTGGTIFGTSGYSPIVITNPASALIDPIPASNTDRLARRSCSVNPKTTIPSIPQQRRAKLPPSPQIPKSQQSLRFPLRYVTRKSDLVKKINTRITHPFALSWTRQDSICNPREDRQLADQ
ncbi:hypothetical protein B0A48_14882 [Cryoendolithus antarcticus]|uniref:Uncharacterized protein n=1 Tax=Cryoendolithus antarcticus TaxID=1507870 RepID=A0A1V8SJG8_9PEZI|nr:hypothetical protein B0A48_14882 [Cryoendolithus antarcticus]